METRTALEFKTCDVKTRRKCVEKKKSSVATGNVTNRHRTACASCNCLHVHMSSSEMFNQSSSYCMCIVPVLHVHCASVYMCTCEARKCVNNRHRTACTLCNCLHVHVQLGNILSIAILLHSRLNMCMHLENSTRHRFTA